jgi:hypothetical protein
MKKLRRALAAVAYVAIPGSTILAATGVGVMGAAALAGVGLLAGGVLHFLNSPKRPRDAQELADQAASAIDAVKAARGKK